MRETNMEFFFSPNESKPNLKKGIGHHATANNFFKDSSTSSRTSRPELELPDDQDSASSLTLHEVLAGGSSAILRRRKNEQNYE